MSKQLIEELDRLAKYAPEHTNWGKLDENEKSYFVALHVAYPTLRELALAGMKLAEAVEKIDVDSEPQGDSNFWAGYNSSREAWLGQRDIALANYRKQTL